MSKGEIRRQLILEQAEALFGQKGYQDTTIDEIAAAAHCTKGSFYYHFNGKTELLTGICQHEAEAMLTAYQKTRAETTVGRLNLLLCCLSPFRPCAEDMIATLLRLHGSSEGMLLEGTLRAWQRKLFKPELQNLLMILNETGAARIARPRLDDVVFEACTAFYDEMCEVLCQCIADDTPIASPVTEAVEAARFMLERVLDMDYGTVEVIKLDEMLPILDRVAKRCRFLLFEEKKKG